MPNTEQYVRLRSHPHPDSSMTPSTRSSLALSPDPDWGTTNFYSHSGTLACTRCPLNASTEEKKVLEKIDIPTGRFYI